MGKKQDNFFRSMLKEIRRRMSPKTRAKTDLKKIRRMVWLYPSHFERRYAKVISQMLKKLTSYATEELKTRVIGKDRPGKRFKKQDRFYKAG